VRKGVESDRYTYHQHENESDVEEGEEGEGSEYKGFKLDKNTKMMIRVKKKYIPSGYVWYTYGRAFQQKFGEMVEYHALLEDLMLIRKV